MYCDVHTVVPGKRIISWDEEVHYLALSHL